MNEELDDQLKGTVELASRRPINSLPRDTLSRHRWSQHFSSCLYDYVLFVGWKSGLWWRS